jgi:hypothetical protein
MPVVNGNEYTADGNFNGNKYADSALGLIPALTDVVAHCEGIFRGTSTSSVTVGNGTKTLTISLNRPIYIGSWVRIEAQANSAISMEGTVTAYDSGTGVLSVSVDPSDVSGAGTLAAWYIFTMGRRGKDGNAGTLATNSVAGVAALATQAEVDGRTITGKIVAPSTLAEGLGLKGTDIASASTLTLPTIGDYFNVTGTTGITAISTRAAGRDVTLVFAASLTVTHNGTSLILPGGANITVAAGDVMRLKSEGSGNWRCVSFNRASLAAGAPAPGEYLLSYQAVTGSPSQIDITSGITSAYDLYVVRFLLVTFNSIVSIGLQIGSGSFTTTNYLYGSSISRSSSGSVSAANSTSASAIMLTAAGDVVSGRDVIGEVIINRADSGSSSGVLARFWSMYSYTAASPAEIVHVVGAGWRAPTPITVIDRIRLLPSSGTFQNAGYVNLYGIRKS